MLRMLTRSRKNIVSLGLSWVPCHLGTWKGDGVLVSLLQGNADMKAKMLPGCLTWRAQRQNHCRTEDRVAELRKQDQSWIWAERQRTLSRCTLVFPFTLTQGQKCKCSCHWAPQASCGWAEINMFCIVLLTGKHEFGFHLYPLCFEM